jgi:hypothetical protein
MRKEHELSSMAQRLEAAAAENQQLQQDNKQLIGEVDSSFGEWLLTALNGS